MRDLPETLGPCCICEAPHAVVLLMLNAQAPIADHGWACVQCGIGADGAIAVVCEACARPFEEGAGQRQGHLEDALRFACRGYPGTEGRIPIEDLRGEHGHNATRHPEIPAVPPMQVLCTDTRFPTHVQEGQGCHCSRCGCTIWEGTIALRAFSQTEDWQYRYHCTCFGAIPIYENFYEVDDVWEDVP